MDANWKFLVVDKLDLTRSATRVESELKVSIIFTVLYGMEVSETSETERNIERRESQIRSFFV